MSPGKKIELGVVVAMVSVVVGIVALVPDWVGLVRGDTETPAPTTQPAPTPPSSTDTSSATPTAPTVPREPRPREPGATNSEGTNGGADWPGGSGYTVVLASKTELASARAVQRLASDAGLDAGVLQSSHFSSLRPGYWVVFSGAYAAQSDATRRQSRARSLGFTDAYVRFVAP